MSTGENIRLIARTPLLSAAVVIGVLNDNNFQNLIDKQNDVYLFGSNYYYFKKKDVKFSRALVSRRPL